MSGRASAKTATALQGKRPKPSSRTSASKLCAGAPLCGTPPTSQEYLPATTWKRPPARTTTPSTARIASGTKPRAPSRQVLAPSVASAATSGPTPGAASGAVPSSIEALGRARRPRPTTSAKVSAKSGSTSPDIAPPDRRPMREPDDAKHQIANAAAAVGRPGVPPERAQHQRQPGDERRVRGQLSRLEHEQRRRSERQHGEQAGALAQQARARPVDRHQRGDRRQGEEEPGAQLAGAEDADAERRHREIERRPRRVLPADGRDRTGCRSGRCRAPAPPAAARRGPRSRKRRAAAGRAPARRPAPRPTWERG